MALKPMLSFLVLGYGVGASDLGVAEEFFNCCEAGHGWAGCSHLVTSEDAQFAIEAVDALPGPPITGSKTVKDYLDWMAGVVQEFGAAATYDVKGRGFDHTTNTAIFYAVFMGYSDYAYMINIDPQARKVSGMRKVFNDQYAFDHIPGTKSQQLTSATNTLGLAEVSDAVGVPRVAQDFFDCCETGKGWDGCSKFVASASSPFAVEAVDALPGPPITGSKTVKDYLDWMAGVVQEFGSKASYDIKARAFDKTTNTALFYAVFMGYSDYVYTIDIDLQENRVTGMRKVFNDQYAFDNIPGAALASAHRSTIGSASFICALSVLVGSAAVSRAVLVRRRRAIREPSLLLG